MHLYCKWLFAVSPLILQYGGRLQGLQRFYGTVAVSCSTPPTQTVYLLICLKRPYVGIESFVVRTHNAQILLGAAKCPLTYPVLFSQPDQRSSGCACINEMGEKKLLGFFQNLAATFCLDGSKGLFGSAVKGLMFLSYKAGRDIPFHRHSLQSKRITCVVSGKVVLCRNHDSSLGL